MQPTQVRQPFHREGWIYEEKIDGWRMLVYKDGRTVRLESRNGVDHTRGFPELAAAVAALPGRKRLCSMVRSPSLTASSDHGSTGCATPTPRKWRRRPC
jgi:hypothetical protein